VNFGPQTAELSWSIFPRSHHSQRAHAKTTERELLKLCHMFGNEPHLAFGVHLKRWDSKTAYFRVVLYDDVST